MNSSEMDRLGDVPAGGTVTGNTYINAFFPDVWNSKCKIDRLGVLLEADGTYDLSLIHVDRFENETLLETTSSAGTTLMWLDSHPKNGRIYIKLQAENDLSVKDLSWVTDGKPLCEPSLSVGLCTFNRESDLSKTVSAINEQVIRTPAIQKVWVVNQGEAFSNSELISALNSPWISVIQQPNLGGCGGFTRSMYETISSQEPTTHLLLMDDDIILDPRMLEKTLLFLRFADENVAVGGQMLEIENPTKLFEAGGNLHPQMFVTPIGENTAVDRPRSLKLFSETLNVDYNAWWYCVIPTAAIRKVGLPPPLFIRGDDIEYGCRLREGGIQILPLPGCPVWHESFAHKGSDWLMYYNLRNRIALSILHPNTGIQRDALYLFGFLLCLILVHRYRATEFALLAINDLTRASNTFNGQAKHAALMKLNANLEGPEEVSAKELPDHVEGTQVPLDTSVLAIIKMCISSIAAIHMNALTGRKPPVKFHTGPQASAVMGREYVTASNPEESKFVVYPVRIASLWRLIIKSAIACTKYAMRDRQHDSAVESHLEALRHPDEWQKAFNAPRD